jgi:hypothetical protein
LAHVAGSGIVDVRDEETLDSFTESIDRGPVKRGMTRKREILVRVGKDGRKPD